MLCKCVATGKQHCENGSNENDSELCLLLCEQVSGVLSKQHANDKAKMAEAINRSYKLNCSRVKVF